MKTRCSKNNDVIEKPTDPESSSELLMYRVL